MCLLKLCPCGGRSRDTLICCGGKSHPDHSHSPMGTGASGFPAVALVPGTEQVLGSCLYVRRIKNHTYKGMDGGALASFAAPRGEGLSLPLLCHRTCGTHAIPFFLACRHLGLSSGGCE